MRFLFRAMLVLVFTQNGQAKEYLINIGESVKDNPALVFKKQDDGTLSRFAKDFRDKVLHIVYRGASIRLNAKLAIVEQKQGVVATVKVWPMENPIPYDKALEKIENKLKTLNISREWLKRNMELRRTTKRLKIGHEKYILDGKLPFEVTLRSNDIHDRGLDPEKSTWFSIYNFIHPGNLPTPPLKPFKKKS